jgi:CDP-4-dehydro-6-deoxyglucose reductase, E3
MEHIPYQLSYLETKTPDITLFSLIPKEKKKIVYQAGQYVEAKLTEDSWIPLSIANAPRQDGLLKFQIRHNDAHPLAKVLFQTLLKQETLFLKGPYGNCTLDKVPADTPLLLLAGGTGFAPLCALLEEALKRGTLRKLHLFWGISHLHDAYAEKQLNDWQKQAPHFTFDLVLSNPEFYQDWSGKTGWVHEHLAKEYPSLKEHCVFVSGPFPMVERAFALFTKQGLKPNHFFSDTILGN